MSTPPPARHVGPASGAVRFFVPAYLLVCGVILFGLAYSVSQSSPDEVFVAGLALVGGITMWLTVLALAILGRRA